MSCVFCKIIAGEIPATRVLETDRVLAFKDINAQAPTHVLLVPKTHYASLNDIPTPDIPSVMGALYGAAREVTETLGLSESGFRTVINTGKWGGQTVFHLHLHLLGGRQLGPGMAG